MNVIRKLLGLTAVLAFALFAQPGLAAKGGSGNGTDKAYSLVMDEQAEYTATTPPAVITPVKVQARLTNEAPPSTSASNVGSWELLITNPGVTILTDPAHQPSGSTNDVVNGNAVATSPTRILITNMSPLKGQQTYVLTFWVTSCGDALWNANVTTGASLNGDPFTRIKDNIDPSTHLATNLQTLISCGTMACGETVDLVADEASLSPELVVKRGPYNSDGACSATSSFFASNKLLTANGQVHFRWPVGDADQKLAVWTYDVVSTNSSVPQLAWLNNDGSKASAVFPDPTVQPPQVPVYVDGASIPCQSDVLPQPYGVLSNTANQNTTTIKVNTSPQNAVLPTPAAPFDIVIGTERMRVTNAQGSTWTVTRHTGLTSVASHSAGAKVMSTPLPLLPDSGVPAPYTAGKQAQMCVVGAPTPVVPATTPPTWSTTIMDLSDGWVRLGQ